MKQLVQSLRTGEVSLLDVPRPQVGPGEVLVQVHASLLSSGTERAMADFAGKSLLGKARARPDLVRQVVAKARQEGVLTAMQTARSRLDQLMPLGYSIAGRVLEAGQGVDRFSAGDRVVCAGAGQASHAEVVVVPVNLTAPLDERVDFESGAFTTLGAVALHGVHLAEAQLGEVVVVIGLGLLGQLTVQLLKSAGCVVAGMDIQGERAEQSRSLGADVVASDLQGLAAGVAGLSNGLGADAVLITADTSSDEPITAAAEVARDRAIVVAVGNVGVNVPRRLYYEKELQLRISRSYGPGRYDPRYEEQGVDYPVGYVRWTENRNMQAVVRLLADGKMDVHPLISHRVPLERAAEEGYGLITGKAGVPYMGVVITYPDVLTEDTGPRPAEVVGSEGRSQSDGLGVGLAGAGAFATSVLLPAMKKVPGIELMGVCSGRGMNARQTADRFNFQFAAPDLDSLLGDATINTIAIATRHNQHAPQVSAALAAGKHVFVEKPLALNREELLDVVRTWSLHPQVLSVGYNRRFSGLAASMKTFLAGIQEPLIMQYRVNAGLVPVDHWIQDPEVGGGRIIGEVCHFIDLLTFLVGSLPVSVSGRALPNHGRYANDNLVATIQFADGSIGEIVYVANGDKAYAKERLEVFGGGSVALLDDFRILQTTRSGRTRNQKSRLTQDKGHIGEWRAFVGAVQGGHGLPISREELIATSLTTFAIRDSLSDGQPRPIDAPALLKAARYSAEG